MNTRPPAQLHCSVKAGQLQMGKLRLRGRSDSSSKGGTGLTFQIRGWSGQRSPR